MSATHTGQINEHGVLHEYVYWVRVSLGTCLGRKCKSVANNSGECLTSYPWQHALHQLSSVSLMELALLTTAVPPIPGLVGVDGLHSDCKITSETKYLFFFRHSGYNYVNNLHQVVTVVNRPGERSVKEI